MINGSITQKIIMILYMYAFNIWIYKYIKILIGLKREKDSKTILFGDLYISLSAIESSNKINKRTEEHHPRPSGSNRYL